MLFRLACPLLLLGMLLTSACGDVASDVNGSNGNGFITLLGDDTLAVESFTRSDGGMTADVVLRAPETSVRRYELELDGDGSLVRYEAVFRGSGDTTSMRREVVVPAGDSLRFSITEGNETQTHAVAGGADALPFIDMVHWPFELMLSRAEETDADSLVQPLFTSRGTMDFVVRKVGPDSMTVTHPYRGTMGVDVGDDGRLERLDAGQTTRKLTVTRVPTVDVEATAQRFSDMDASGSSFGPLSGRGEAQAEIDGATISVDYGQPSKRGRTIFGELVPWGERWRTGANRATHFETSRALRLGGADGVDVPAGQYTLYTIPEPDGGTLIVNRQTGQGGTSYDEAQDLGRVPMQRSDLDQTVEDFTIRVDEAESGGVLKLQWDQTEFSVPFTVAE